MSGSRPRSPTRPAGSPRVRRTAAGAPGAADILTAADGASAERPDTPEARALLEALRAVARELRLTEQRERPQLGVPPAQLRVLRELSVRPAASLGELATRTYTDPSSASVVVQRLVERGLVMREESEADRRRTVLTLTPAGRGLVAAAPADAVSRVAEAISPLGEARATALARGLRALARELRAGHDEPSAAGDLPPEPRGGR